MVISEVDDIIGYGSKELRKHPGQSGTCSQEERIGRDLNLSAKETTLIILL